TSRPWRLAIRKLPMFTNVGGFTQQVRPAKIAWSPTVSCPALKNAAPAPKRTSESFVEATDAFPSVVSCPYRYFCDGPLIARTPVSATVRLPFIVPASQSMRPAYWPVPSRSPRSVNRTFGSAEKLPARVASTPSSSARLPEPVTRSPSANVTSPLIASNAALSRCTSPAARKRMFATPTCPRTPSDRRRTLKTPPSLSNSAGFVQQKRPSMPNPSRATKTPWLENLAPSPSRRWPMTPSFFAGWSTLTRPARLAIVPARSLLSGPSSVVSTPSRVSTASTRPPVQRKRPPVNVPTPARRPPGASSSCVDLETVNWPPRVTTAWFATVRLPFPANAVPSPTEPGAISRRSFPPFRLTLPPVLNETPERTTVSAPVGMSGFATVNVPRLFTRGAWTQHSRPESLAPTTAVSLPVGPLSKPTSRPTLISVAPIVRRPLFVISAPSVWSAAPSIEPVAAPPRKTAVSSVPPPQLKVFVTWMLPPSIEAGPVKVNEPRSTSSPSLTCGGVFPGT